jgi:DNA-binding response OmpR family regulator
MKHKPLILVVDDDSEVAKMLARSLSHRGFVVETTTSPAEALELAATTTFDAALLDLVMPGLDGVALAAALRKCTPGLVVAILTGYGHSPLIEAARQSGVSVFKKPTAIQDVVTFLEAEIPRKIQTEDTAEVADQS